MEGDLLGLIGKKLLTTIQTMQSEEKIAANICICPEADFYKDLGFCEITMTELIMNMESALDVSLPVNQGEIKTIGEMVSVFFNLTSKN